MAKSIVWHFWATGNMEGCEHGIRHSGLVTVDVLYLRDSTGLVD